MRETGLVGHGDVDLDDGDVGLQRGSRALKLRWREHEQGGGDERFSTIPRIIATRTIAAGRRSLEQLVCGIAPASLEWRFRHGQ